MVYLCMYCILWLCTGGGGGLNLISQVTEGEPVQCKLFANGSIPRWILSSDYVFNKIQYMIPENGVGGLLNKNGLEIEWSDPFNWSYYR